MVRGFATPIALDSTTPVAIANDDTLEKGDTGATVTVLQKLLYNLNYKITVDGIFGLKTEDAIKEFQKKNNLTVTGVVTPEVLGIIREEVASPNVAEKKFTTGAFIRKGNSGSAVLTIQQALNVKGAYPKVDEDGVFGSGTLTALKAFQKKESLEVDGIVGPSTFKALGVNDI